MSRRDDDYDNDDDALMMNCRKCSDHILKDETNEMALSLNFTPEMMFLPPFDLDAHFYCRIKKAIFLF